MRTKKTLLIAAVLTASPLLAQKSSFLQTNTPKPTGATGGIIYISGANAFSYLPAGTNGQFLRLASGLPAWATFSLSMFPNGTEGDWLVAGASSPAFGKIAGKEPSGWLQQSTLDQFIVRGRLAVGATYASTLTADARTFSVYSGTNTSTAFDVESMGIFAPNLANGGLMKMYWGKSTAQYNGWVWTYKHGNNPAGVGHYLWLRSTDTTTGRTIQFNSKDTAGSSLEPDFINFQLNGADIGTPACYAGFGETVWGCYKFVIQSTSGNIGTIRNLSGYTWPSAHASGPLCNNGTGTLSFGTCSSATVTSVGLSMPSIFSVSGSPVTGSGTLTATLATQSANLVFSGPTSAGAAVPTFRSLVPADVPTLNQDTTGKSAKTDALNSATTVVNVSAATAPSTGQVLTATDSTHATWQTASAGAASDLLSATTTVNVSASTAPSSGQVLTATDSTHATWQTPSGGGGSAFAGQVYMKADQAITPATGYEQLRYGLTPLFFTLKPNFDFGVTKANAITSVPEGWAWVNSGTAQAADENTTTANALFMQARNGGGTTDWWAGVFTAPMLCKEIDNAGGTDLLLRFKVPTASQGANKWTIPLMIVSKTNNAEFVRFDLNNLQLRAAWSSTAGSAFTLTAGNLNTGIWLRLRGSVGTWHWQYSQTNSATPPTDWTGLDYRSGVGPGLPTWQLCFGVLNPSNLTPGPVIHLQYFNDRQVLQTINFDALVTPGKNLGLGGSGFDDSGLVQQLVTDFDLGASTATTTDANLREALAAITNRRLGDSAVATASAVRCASTSCACGSYTAIASVSWSGSGRYASVCEKLTSTGRILPGSLDVRTFAMKWNP